MMTPQSIAINRFGLGFRQGDDLPRDPKGWLRGQISAYDPRPGELRSLDLSGQRVEELVSQVADQRKELAEIKKSGEADAQQRFKKAHRENSRELKTLYATDVGLRLRTAADSPTPFMERMVHFWANHFAVSTALGPLTNVVGAYEFGAIRPHVAGKFADLLKSASLHPAMLAYLSQNRSIGPNSPLVKARKSRGMKGLNENLGREILELHTLGAGGGYTQADVIELAKALTGWVGLNYDRLPGAQRVANGNAFVPGMHEPGTRTLMGKRYAEGGAEQVMAIFDDIAVHPSTATHVATKLSRHFAGDNPPPAMVERVAKRFRDTGGDLPAVYQAVIDSPETWVERPLKVRQPFEWMVAVVRAAGKQLVTDWRIAALAKQVGQPTWGPDSPAGWDDLDASWMGPDALMRRVEVADILSQKTRLSDVRSLAQMMFPGSLSKTTEDVVRVAESNQMALALLAVSPEMLRR